MFCSINDSGLQLGSVAGSVPLSPPLWLSGLRASEHGGRSSKVKCHPSSWRPPETEQHHFPACLALDNISWHDDGCITWLCISLERIGLALILITVQCTDYRVHVLFINNIEKRLIKLRQHVQTNETTVLSKGRPDLSKGNILVTRWVGFSEKCSQAYQPSGLSK